MVVEYVQFMNHRKKSQRKQPSQNLKMCAGRKNSKRSIWRAMNVKVSILKKFSVLQRR